VENDIVLQTHQLKKYFKAVHAVEDVSLSVVRGEIFGFLGLNGAGKTTTIGLMLGLIHPTAGNVEIFGQPVSPGHTAALRRVGALVEAPALVPYLSARGNLALLAKLYPDIPPARINQVLEMVGLTESANRRAKQFSTGMKQRLGLALALLNQPDLLILDEPTNGLDPAGMHEIRMLFQTLAEQGVTIFLSSHLLHEMQMICDRVAVVQGGRIIAQGKVKELLGNVHESIHIATPYPERTAQALREIPDAYDIQVKADSVEVRGISSETTMNHLVHHGLTPKEVSVARPDLESIFLELTGKTS
jgi:ABC-type multidrug transport system ATPase subunit